MSKIGPISLTTALVVALLAAGPLPARAEKKATARGKQTPDQGASAGASAPAGAPSAGAPRLSIEEALAVARKNNRDLRAAQARLQQSSAGIEQARAALMPIASAQGKFTHNYKEVDFNFGAIYQPLAPVLGSLAQQVPGTAPQVNAFNAGLQAAAANPAVIQKQEQLDGVLQVTLPLVVPSAYAGLSAAKRTYEASEANYDSAIATILINVAQAFYTAAGTDELIRVRQHAISVAQETLDNAQARFSTGVVNRVEVTRAELALLRAKQALVEALDSQSQAYRSLATILDQHTEFRVEPPANPPQPVQATPELSREALQKRPEIAAAERQLEANSAQESAALWRWAPSLSAFANARAFNYAGFSGDKYAWALGAQLDWTLYDGGVRDAERHSAAAQHSENEARLEQLRDQVSDEIANAARVADTKRQALETAKRSVDLSSETLELVRAQHDAGTATQIDLLQAQDNLVAAEVSVAQARFDLALAALAFERAAGLFPKKE